MSSNLDDNSISSSLTPRQKRFCEEYVISLNGSKSAIKAGFSKHSAGVQSTRLLKNVNVQNYIKDLQKDIEESSRMKAHDVVRDLCKLADWDIKTFVEQDNMIKDLSKLTTEELAPVVGIKTKKTTYSIEGRQVTEITTELKLSDKHSALVTIGRHLGIFEKDNKQGQTKITVTKK
jgi:phage terminase small subunit